MRTKKSKSSRIGFSLKFSGRFFIFCQNRKNIKVDLRFWRGSFFYTDIIFLLSKKRRHQNGFGYNSNQKAKTKLITVVF